jgi:hypothetical protein
MDFLQAKMAMIGNLRLPQFLAFQFRNGVPAETPCVKFDLDLLDERQSQTLVGIPSCGKGV